jgi:hypothetical protein
VVGKENMVKKTAWEAYVVAVVKATMKEKQANGDPVSPTNVTPGDQEQEGQ